MATVVRYKQKYKNNFNLKKFYFILTLTFNLCSTAPTITQHNSTEISPKESITIQEYEISTTTPKILLETSTSNLNELQTSSITPRTLIPSTTTTENSIIIITNDRDVTTDVTTEKISTLIQNNANTVRTTIMMPKIDELITRINNQSTPASLQTNPTEITTTQNLLSTTNTENIITKPPSLQKYKKYPKNRSKKLKEKNLKYHQSLNNPSSTLATTTFMPSTTESIILSTRPSVTEQKIKNGNKIRPQITTMSSNVLTTTLENDITTPKEEIIKSTITSTKNNEKIYDIENKTNKTKINNENVSLLTTTTTTDNIADVPTTLNFIDKKSLENINLKNKLIEINNDDIKNLKITTIYAENVTQKSLRATTNLPLVTSTLLNEKKHFIKNPKNVPNDKIEKRKSNDTDLMETNEKNMKKYLTKKIKMNSTVTNTALPITTETSNELKSERTLSSTIETISAATLLTTEISSVAINSTDSNEKFTNSIDSNQITNTLNPLTDDTTIVITTTPGKVIKIIDVEKNNSKDIIKNVRKNELSDSVITTTPLMRLENEKSNESSSNNNENSKNGTQMGHDGVKITKKKQLLEKHYENPIIRKTNDKEIINDNQNKGKEKGHILGPIIMKEKVLSNTKDMSIIQGETTTTAMAVATVTTTEEPAILDIDLKPIQNNNEDTFTSKQFLTSTIDPIIEHQIYEQSLISQMEWIPIKTVPHTTRDPNYVFEETTMQPTTSTSGNIYLESEIMNTESIPEVQITEVINDTDAKSLEIELIDSSSADDVNLKNKLLNSNSKKIVPEFFEIKGKTPNKSEPDLSPIEIQINVSEGFGTENENLEFSFRQPSERQTITPPIHKEFHPSHILPGFQEIGEITIDRSADIATSKPLNTEIIDAKPKDLADEILELEITAIDNSTDQSDNFNPKFTVHNDQQNHENDDFFIPDLKVDQIDENSKSESTVDRDSDTIFYISNTEVKVVESVPPSTKSSVDNNNLKLESNYFTTELNAHNNKTQANLENNNEGKKNFYEEDIILSPMRNAFDSIKISENYNNHNNNNEDKEKIIDAAASEASSQADISYVGETFIEIEESTNPTILATTALISKKDTDQPLIMHSSDTENSSGALLSDVIIQPAVIPEMSIGVPVIGELPPQIELKEIDFVPGNGKNKGGNNNDGISDGSIQYGSDLIDDGATAAQGDANIGRYIFESGYPFGGEKVNHIGRVHNFDGESDEGEDEDDGDNDNDSKIMKSQIIMHPVNNFQKESFLADTPGEEMFKLVPNKKDDLPVNSSQLLNSTILGINVTSLGNSSEDLPEKLGNATAYSILDDSEQEMSLTDVQTLLIACAATLIPLILSLLLAFGVRYLWKKYRQDGDDDEDEEGGGLVSGGDNDEQIGIKSQAIAQDELQTTESGYTLNRSNDTLDTNADYGGVNNGSHTDIQNNGNFNGYISPTNNNNNNNNNNNKNMIGNHTGANGSVITMTLKNNHLIVETEERNDISRDARETKINYNSSDKDGVFVVEVARGADAQNGAIHGSPMKDSCRINIEQQPIAKEACQEEEVQIHQPPTDKNIVNAKTKIDEEEPHQMISSYTGLSQSDLSSSSCDSNKGYTYGNQSLYTNEKSDYISPVPKVKFSPSKTDAAINNDYSEPDNDNNTKKSESNAGSKPIITAALLKQDTVIEITGKSPKSNGNDKINNTSETNVEEKNELTIKSMDLVNGGENEIDELPLPPPTDISNNENDAENKLEILNEINMKNLARDDDQNSEIDEQLLLGNEKQQHQENGLNGSSLNGHIYNDEINGIENINGKIENAIENNINENGFDSIISLPEPPSTDEIIQMNDIVCTGDLDSLPPPPPPLSITSNIENNNNDINEIIGKNNLTIFPSTNGIKKNGNCDSGPAITVAITESS